MHPAEIKLNDQIYDPASSELIFFPGKPHTLHITPKWEILNQKSVIAILKGSSRWQNRKTTIAIVREPASKCI